MAGSATEIGRASGYDLPIGFAAALLGGILAGVFTGVYWREAGLLIGPGYWGLYLGALAVAFLAGRRQFARGMVISVPIAVPAYFGLAVYSAATSALS